MQNTSKRCMVMLSYLIHIKNIVYRILLMHEASYKWKIKYIKKMLYSSCYYLNDNI